MPAAIATAILNIANDRIAGSTASVVVVHLSEAAELEENHQ
jgi:hypothetical protein